jgi:hypothetical protein
VSSATKARIAQGGAMAGLVAGVLVGGPVLMDRTLSRHDDIPAGSALVVEMTIATRSGVEAEDGEIVEALVVACQLEVRSSVETDSIETIGHNRFRFVMRPSLDESDRRQLTGCLQDFRIDNVLANVVSMEER